MLGVAEGLHKGALAFWAHISYGGGYGVNRAREALRELGALGTDTRMNAWSMFFFSSRRRHTRFDCDWSSDVCSSDLRHLRHRGDDLAQTGLVEVVPSMSVMTASLASGQHGPGHLDAAGLRALGRETGADRKSVV